MLVSNQTLKEGFNMCQQNNTTKSKKGKHHERSRPLQTSGYAWRLSAGLETSYRNAER